MLKQRQKKSRGGMRVEIAGYKSNPQRPIDAAPTTSVGCLTAWTYRLPQVLCRLVITGSSPP